MKKIFASIFIILFLLNFSSFLIAQNENNKEYLILRATHLLKRTGVESRLEFDIGTFKNHSLINIIQSGEDGSIIFNIDAKKIVIRSEVDFINIANSFGYHLFSISEIEVSGKNYLQYLLYKQID